MPQILLYLYKMIMHIEWNKRLDFFFSEWKSEDLRMKQFAQGKQLVGNKLGLDRARI